jgi:hypothetical protein
MNVRRSITSCRLDLPPSSSRLLSSLSPPVLLLAQPLLTEWPRGCAESLQYIDRLLHRGDKSFLQRSDQYPVRNPLRGLSWKLSTVRRLLKLLGNGPAFLHQVAGSLQEQDGTDATTRGRAARTRAAHRETNHDVTVRRLAAVRLEFSDA